MASTDYFVEAILGKKGSGAKTKYLIKWQGFGDEENTWELALNLREDGLGSSITKYESTEVKRKANKPKTPQRGRAKSPARKKTPTKKTPTKSPKKKTPAKAKSPRKKSPAPKRAKSPARKKASPPPDDAPAPEDVEVNDEDVADAVRAVENLANPAGVGKQGDAGPVSYAAVQLPASAAWLAGFMLAVLVAVVLRLTNDGSSAAVAYLQLFFELVPPALCVMAVWNTESDDYSDKVGAVLPWMVALPALENLRRILEDTASASITTAFLLALVFLFALMATIHKNSTTPTATLVLPVLVAGASANYLKELGVLSMEFGLTWEFLDEFLIGAALCFAWIALFQSVAHVAEAPNPMASGALSRWVGMTAVLFSFSMLAFALLGVLGKMQLEGATSDFYDGDKLAVKATADLSAVVTYYSLRWFSSLAFVVSVKVDQSK